MKEQKAFGADLEKLAAVLAQFPNLLKVFKNPIIRTEDKKKVASKLLTKIKANKVVKNFCMFLADKGRLGNFPEIQAYYQLLLDAREGVMRGKVVTAIDLSKGKKDAIQKALEKEFAKKLILDFEQEPGILGGLVLKVGDKVYDASLKAQLDNLKANIKRGE